MPQPSDLPPERLPAAERLTRDQAAACWFLYLEMVREMGTISAPNAMVAQLVMRGAAKTSAQVRSLAEKDIQKVLGENTQATRSLIV